MHSGYSAPYRGVASRELAKRTLKASILSAKNRGQGLNLPWTRSKDEFMTQKDPYRNINDQWATSEKKRLVSAGSNKVGEEMT